MMQPINPSAASLLDDIHQRLLARRYDQLEALSLALERALSAPQNLDAAALKLIHAKAQRNAATLAAVQRGIRAAMRRVVEIRSVSTALVTYDKSGLRQESVTFGVAQRL
jgi:hypothetical protein